MRRPVQSITRRPGAAGYTLIELLVVMAIIAALAAFGVPALRGMNKGRTLDAAARQLVNDLQLARLKAISSRSTVYLVFAPTNLQARLAVETLPQARAQLTNLVGAQYSAYALVSARSVGDQPGRGQPSYLTEWKRLPDGVLVHPIKFLYNGDRSLVDGLENDRFEFTAQLPFPITEAMQSGGQAVALPYIGFNSLGGLTSMRDEQITLVPGNVWVYRDANGDPKSVEVDYRKAETNSLARILVNGLTGRAASVRPELP